jgi:ADP-heptose:LPS heptosyltransferase
MRLGGSRKDRSVAFCLGDGCGVGNFVQALPALQALHEAGYSADVFVSSFMYSDMTDLVTGQPYIRALYENTYDSTQPSYDVCVVSFLSDHRVAQAKKFIKLKTTWKKRSEYEQYCWAAEKLGVKNFKPPVMNLSTRNFHLKPLNILIHAGCAQKDYWARKKWHKYKKVIDLLLKDNFTVYCCGKEDEIIDHPAVTPFTDMPIQETAALINQCDLFLSNDSGLMHIAAALRKRQIAVFTATDHKKSGPYYNPRAHVITPRVKCYPCQGNSKVWDNCRDWLCREVISEENVYGEIRKIIDFKKLSSGSSHG